MPVQEAGKAFKEALQIENPLQVVGVVNACSALLAKQAGFKALYLSGAGLANSAFALPDLGMTSLTEVVEEARRITGVVDLPLLVDGDTGFGGQLNVKRTVQELIKAGAAGVHFEDQAWPKRCGHRPNKTLVSTKEMVGRIIAAVEAKRERDFVIIARTDAFAKEGLSLTINRSIQYVKAGADAIFVEALTKIEQYRTIVDALPVPVLANITEFGQTPLFSLSELQEAGIQLVLYPLSAFRAMNKTATMVYRTIREKGTQQDLLPIMQTREELYDLLNYYDYERQV